MVSIFDVESDQIFPAIKNTWRRFLCERYKESTIFPSSLAKGRIYEFYVGSEVSAGSNYLCNVMSVISLQGHFGGGEALLLSF